MLYPVLAALPCSECRDWQIDYDWQKQTGTGRRQQRHGQDWKRIGPPPCLERPGETPPICPKKSPEHEAEFQFSPTNRRVWELFLALQGGAEMTEAEREDKHLRRKLAMLADLWERDRQRKQADATAAVVMMTLARTGR